MVETPSLGNGSALVCECWNGKKVSHDRHIGIYDVEGQEVLNPSGDYFIMGSRPGTREIRCFLRTIKWQCVYMALINEIIIKNLNLI